MILDLLRDSCASPVCVGDVETRCTLGDGVLRLGGLGDVVSGLRGLVRVSASPHGLVPVSAIHSDLH